jgi:hypothetical protein
MLHYEMGKNVDGITFGAEASYWWEDPSEAIHFLSVPSGLDMGVEFTHTKIRVYSEVQTGLLLRWSREGAVFAPGFFAKGVGCSGECNAF